MTTSDDNREPGIEDHREPGILEAELAEEEALTKEERDPEASPEDVQEQIILADPGEDEDESPHLRDDVSEWDAVEQARVVELDEDYR